MRYLDWDVLLFPSGADAPGVPFKEFKTQCQVERTHPNEPPTPLLTSFVPSLPPGNKFQISLHSWTAAGTSVLGLAPGPDGRVPKEVWEVRVVVDGKGVTVAHLGADGLWPQIIATATHEHGRELAEQEPLRFPPFHDYLRNERSWSAADVLGRIRVELTVGVWDEKQGYLKMANIVTFAFQHAPIKVLEQAGIAWPSYEMFHHPVPRSGSSPQMPAETSMHNPHMAHRKMPSMGSLNLPGVGGSQPLANPVNPYQNINNFDPASRSTSAYSNVSASAGPILNGFQMAASPQQQQTTAPAKPNRENMPYSFRLPSDQLAQIIQALNPRKHEQHTQQASDSMPPPPVPGQMFHLKNGNENTPIGHVAPLAHKTQRTEMDQHAINAIDRRGASNSNYSDISMHAGCTAFPQCITEDPEGCLHHHNTAAPPAAMVKGKKEGASSPTKPRDFFSVALEAPAQSGAAHPTGPQAQPRPQQTSMPMTMAPRDMMTSPAKATASSALVSSSPADASGRKRTRSALRELSLNSGSPEKSGVGAADKNKPVRKASRASASSNKSKESFVSAHDKEKENQNEEGEGDGSQFLEDVVMDV